MAHTLCDHFGKCLAKTFSCGVVRKNLQYFLEMAISRESNSQTGYLVNNPRYDSFYFRLELSAHKFSLCCFELASELIAKFATMISLVDMPHIRENSIVFVVTHRFCLSCFRLLIDLDLFDKELLHKGCKIQSKKFF